VVRILAKRPQRSAVIALSVLAHAAVLAVLLRAPSPTAASAAAEGLIGVSLLDGKPAVAQHSAAVNKPRPRQISKPAPEHEAPRLPVDPPDIVPQYVDFEPAADEERLNRDPSQDPVAVAVAESAAPGHSCQLGGWLQAALRADPAVQAALAAIPRADRSIANAIMLWDVRWVRQPSSALNGASALRSALMVGVRAAPAECQTQLIRGPELLALTDSSGTTLIAIGSGEWRWADLLARDPNDIAVADARF
jgi:hypothetical protein